MRNRCVFDWRIVWEIASLVVLSALIGIGGIYFLGPLVFTKLPDQNLVPEYPLSISSFPSSSHGTSPAKGSTPKLQAGLPGPPPSIKGTAIHSSQLNSSQVNEAISSLTLMTQVTPSARIAESTPQEPSPMVTPLVASKPSEEQALKADPNVRELPADLVEAENPPLREGGEFTINGVVLTAMGQPIPGIRVKASVHRLFDNDKVRVGSIEDRYAQSDEVGFYEFENLFAGEYLLRTEATPSYRPASRRVRAGIKQVILVLIPEGVQEVNGLVKDGGTRYPLPGVSIAAAGQMVTSDEQGFYQISVPRQNGRQASTILRFIHQDYHQELVTVPRQGTSLESPIALSDVLLKPIQGFSSLKGTVESLYGGDALGGVRVFLAPVKGYSQLDALTNNEGIFQFSSVAWGTYTLVVAPTEGHKDFKQENLVVGEGPIEDIQIRLEPSPVGVLRGQLVDPEGQPVRGLTLWLRSLSVRTFAGKAVTSDQSGNIEVYDVPSGEIQLSTQAEPHLRITGLNLKPGEFLPVQLVVDWGSQVLNGQIVDAGGLPIPGAAISLIWMQEKEGMKSRAIRTTSTDDIGVFRFTQLGTGPHTLNVSAEGYRGTLLERVIGPDQSDVRVVLSKSTL